MLIKKRAPLAKHKLPVHKTFQQ